jgi:hypothetical protein
MKTYVILGGGGSFGIHAAKYLLDHANPKRVIGIGRNPLRPEPFTLGIEKIDGYEYHAYHLTYEMDLLLELLDKIKPDVIVNFAAQGEGAVSWKHSWRFFETNSMALAKLSEELMKRDWLERCLDVMALDPETAPPACGVPCGARRPEYGPSVVDLQCAVCGATWAGIVGDPCEWCDYAAEKQRKYQAELDKQQAEINAGKPANLEALSTAIAALDPKAKALGSLVPKAAA